MSCSSDVVLFHQAALCIRVAVWTPTAWQLFSQEAQMVALTSRESANFLCLLAYPVLVHQQEWTESCFTTCGFFLLGLTPVLCFLADMANLSLHDHDGSSGASDQDTLAPLPHPGAAPWPMAFPYQYPPPHPYNPHPGFPDPGYSYGGGSAGSQHSEGE